MEFSSPTCGEYFNIIDPGRLSIGIVIVLRELCRYSAKGGSTGISKGRRA